MKKERGLIGMEPIEDIIETVIHTAFVAESIPISIMLVAPSGGGKSATTKRYEGKMIEYADDVTSAGLHKVLAPDRENRVKFLNVPEFNTTLSHKSSVVNLTLANLLSATQDGTVRVMDGRSNQDVKHDPIGILACVTPDIYMANARRFRVMGFTRRVIPIHFSYGLDTQRKAMIHIKHGNHSQKPLPPIVIADMKRQVVTVPSKLANEVEMLSTIFAQNLSQYSYYTDGKLMIREGVPLLPMAPFKVLSSIIRAHAILHGRTKCEEHDLAATTSFVSFTNMRERVLL